MGSTQKTLDRTYREFDAKCADLVHEIAGSHRYEGEVRIPGPGERDRQRVRWEGLLGEARSLGVENPVQALLREHFQEFISGQISGVNTTYAHPARFVGGQTRFIDRISRQDSRPSDERSALLLGRLGHIEEVWRGTQQLLVDAAPDKRKEAVVAWGVFRKVVSNVTEGISFFYPGLGETGIQDLKAGLLAVGADAAAWEAEAASLAGKGDGHTPDVAQAGYETILREELGVSLGELLRWHESEIEGTRDAMLRSASAIEPRVKGPKDVSELLAKVAGPADSVPEMFSRMRGYVADAKAACKMGYVDLPEEECLVVPAPEMTKDDFPWGGYGGGCRRRRPLVGECFLNETNYRAVTDGWMKMMAIHECYPGHHVQFVKGIMDPLPATVSMGARSIPLVEGVAHRSELLMEGIFPDPAFPVFVRLRRHHTAVRIKADLYLHYYGHPVDDVVQLYMDELGFDQNTARGQVRYQERNPGYMTCYYYGMKRLQDLESAYMPDEREFTQTLFSVGRISLSSLERFLQLDPTDRVRFQTEYKSLLDP